MGSRGIRKDSHRVAMPRLVYANGVREHIDAARRRQTRTAANDVLAATTATAGWKVEQQLLQQDNRRLREEVDRLKAAVRRSLGQYGGADLGNRVEELTTLNQQLQSDLENGAGAHRRGHRVIRVILLAGRAHTFGCFGSGHRSRLMW